MYCSHVPNATTQVPLTRNAFKQTRKYVEVRRRDKRCENLDVSIYYCLDRLLGLSKNYNDTYLQGLRTRLMGYASSIQGECKGLRETWAMGTVHW